jgi:hypothetical protein
MVPTRDLRVRAVLVAREVGDTKSDLIDLQEAAI